MEPQDYTPALTPVQRRGDVWLKRDDLYCLGGVRGGKVRACWSLCSGHQNLRGVTTASHRPSPQSGIVAAVAKRLGVPCRVHTPYGPHTDQMQFAESCGAEITQHDCGYNNVIIKRARDDAAVRGWLHVPFGMECVQAVESVADQVRNLPAGMKRLVVPTGSAISLSGILRGLRDWKIDVPVLAVLSGADSRERLDRWAPANWRKTVTLQPASHKYHEHVTASVGGVVLDPVYEAKCVEFLRPDDCLWVVGIRRGIASADDHV